MQINESKTRNNIEYTTRWFNRAVKDFNLFKKLVKLDNKMKKSARCSDPALAVYLLQQSIEKTVKAVAIASGQYEEVRDFIHFYNHNSLALIINLNNKMIAKLKDLGLGQTASLMGIDFADGESNLDRVENQVLGKIPLMAKSGEQVSFKAESLALTPEMIDGILNSSILLRDKLLEVVKTIFSILHSMGVGKSGNIEDTDKFIKTLSSALSSRMNTTSLSDEQLKAPGEFIKFLDGFGLHQTTARGDINRNEMITTYLSVWGFSYSLLWLSYITYAHESSSRYPLKHKGTVKSGRLGCDDYNNNLGIVNRIGQIGYATSLTLSEIKNEIESVAYLFVAEKP